jgi:hypothetical protein
MNVSEAVVNSVRSNGRSMRAEIVSITPAMAQEWLSRNVNNRTPTPKRIELYASAMKAGKWRLTHQGIAFDELGFLSDGQNRLMAIVKSGVTVRMWVFRGMPCESRDELDTGRPRSAADTLHFLGDEVSRQSVAVARVMYSSYRAQRGGSYNIHYAITNDTLRVFHGEMYESIQFAAYASNRKGLSHASFFAAVAAAWWTVDKDLLSQFKDHVSSGIVTSEADTGAIRIRELLLSGTLAHGGRNARAELFLRSCTALRAYIERRPLTKLYCRHDAHFPIPDVDGV